ncbi:MAG: hypothetical protein ACRC2Y_04250 [Aeromonas veronii]
MNRESFLALGTKPKKVRIKSINQDIYLRELSYAAAVGLGRISDPAERVVITVISSVCDEAGNLLFLEDDTKLISQNFNFMTLQEIAAKVAEITTFTDDDLVK